MNDFFDEMNKKQAQHAAKQSIGAKSLPSAKQPISVEASQPAPTKSVATKQGSLFGWMGKKA